jgi:cyclopropane-fatty-acyl-phospholipid synthase
MTHAPDHADLAARAIRATPEVIAVLAAPVWVKMALRVLLRLSWGCFTVVLPDGQALRFEGRHPGREGIFIVRDYRFAARLIRNGNIGLAEGYLTGEWDSPDLPALLEVGARNTEEIREFFRGRTISRWASQFFHFFNRNTRTGSRRNIEYHYDLGNAFYEKWLDPTMTYSSARFAHAGQTLTDAQINKYRSLATRMGLTEGGTVLEIGSGWGGFAEFAAREIGARVTGITISKQQLEYSRERMFRAGLNEKVDIQYRDYRDMTGQYDHVASIEMFEAVGEKYWPAYFTKIREMLKPGGRAGLQIITIRDDIFGHYRRNVDFIQRYIFPGGMLPSPSALMDQARNTGLKWVENIDFGQDYAATLAAWRDRFLEAWPEINQMGFDERFKRLWTYYLAYCEAGFRAGNTDVTQISLARA